MQRLALVQGIVRLTKAESVETYAASIQARVATLARTHTLLARRSWSDIPLIEVVAAEAATHDLGRFEIAGPELMVAANHVQSLALVFSEMASNAATHGSLRRAQGRVTITWRLNSTPGFVTLQWREAGDPTPPMRASGFGERMIDGILKQQLRGGVTRSWTESGLDLEMTFPAHAV